MIFMTEKTWPRISVLFLQRWSIEDKESPENYLALLVKI